MSHCRAAGKARFAELHFRQQIFREFIAQQRERPGIKLKDRAAGLGFGYELAAKCFRQFLPESRADRVIIQRCDELRLDAHFQQGLQRRLHRDDACPAGDVVQQMHVFPQRRSSRDDHCRGAAVTIAQA